MPEEEQFPSNSDDLEFAQRLLELTTIVQKNSATIEELKKAGEVMGTKSQDLDIELGKKLNDFNDNLISKMKDNYAELSSENDTLKEALETQKEYFSSEIEALTEVITSQEKHFNDKFSSFKQDQETMRVSLVENEDKIENLSDVMKEGFSEASEHLSETESKLKSSVSALGELLRTQFETVSKTTSALKTSVDSLNGITQAHTEAFDNVRESLISFKEKLQEIISMSKKDQQAHFENFSRMLESFNENIRTEITLTTQNLKESDIQILNEVSDHYTRKKVGDDLQQAFGSFSEELQQQTSRTKEEMTQNLQNSMNEYEKIIESQSQSIQTYKEELETIQSEIQAVIDRKVNEKYEAVFSLLSTVALHAEELSMLIKTAEIHLPESISSTVENDGGENPDS
ncbi:MAG: hypothetical protein ACW98F_17785 [Candidatus Hodarchaeales archaeon]